MQKQILIIYNAAGKQYMDDLLHLLEFWSVQPVDTLLSHETMAAKEPSDLKSYEKNNK